MCTLWTRNTECTQRFAMSFQNINTTDCSRLTAQSKTQVRHWQTAQVQETRDVVRADEDPGPNLSHIRARVVRNQSWVRKRSEQVISKIFDAHPEMRQGPLSPRFAPKPKPFRTIFGRTKSTNGSLRPRINNKAPNLTTSFSIQLMQAVPLGLRKSGKGSSTYRLVAPENSYSFWPVARRCPNPTCNSLVPP